MTEPIQPASENEASRRERLSKAYGNAIAPQIAAVFVREVMEMLGL